MIPRSVRLIFAACEALKAKGWVYKIEASFMEIYNEQIRDLLGPSGGNHEIRVVNSETIVTNLKVKKKFLVHQMHAITIVLLRSRKLLTKGKWITFLLGHNNNERWRQLAVMNILPAATAYCALSCLVSMKTRLKLLTVTQKLLITKCKYFTNLLFFSVNQVYYTWLTSPVPNVWRNQVPLEID